MPNKLQKKRPEVRVNQVEDEKRGESSATRPVQAVTSPVISVTSPVQVVTSPVKPHSRRVSTATLRSALARHLADLSTRLEKPSTSFSTSSTAYVKSLTDKAPPPSTKYFRSRRINRKELDISWLQKAGFDWIGFILPILGGLIGLAVATILIWNKIRVIENANYCPVLLEDWSNGFNELVWQKEVQTNGFGNREFEVTTDTEENVFIEDGTLHIKPTLQDAELVEFNNTLDMRNSCTATSDLWASCVAITNTYNGSIIPPTKSGRINTRRGASIKYGRVEVEAQMPAGDWLWPAIWLLPVENIYGDWPRSGEIDIMESWGNNASYPGGGSTIMKSSIHWGPDSGSDRYYLNVREQAAKLSTFSDGFHIFGLEWTPKYLFTYMDSRLLQVTFVDFNQPFWQRGKFNSAITNPWGQTGLVSTPFDQDFYLIINVAVGGRNNWFPDGLAGKPWVDSSDQAPLQFWNGRDQWLPTWEKGGATMKVRSVRMYQQEGFNGCVNGTQVWR